MADVRYASGVAIRFVIGGIEYSVDTPQEAADLQAVLTRKTSATKAATARWSTPARKRRIATPAAPPPNKLIQALYDADKALDRDGLAKALDVKVTAITPMWGHAMKWVEQVSPGAEFFEKVVQKTARPHLNGSMMTSYKLTAFGRKLVEEANS